MTEMTTIKVSKPLRERISAAAARQDATMQRFLERVMDDHERRKRFDAVADALRGADESALASWRGEVREWETVDDERMTAD